MKDTTQRQYLGISDSLPELHALENKSSDRIGIVYEISPLINKINEKQWTQQILLGSFPYY